MFNKCNGLFVAEHMFKLMEINRLGHLHVCVMHN